jgi:hypothetical protein
MADTKRQDTLKLLHDNDRTSVDRNNAIIMMAVRYGQARALVADRSLDYELVDRARERRFAALMRLVYGR